MSLTVVNLSQTANKIGRPFAVVALASIGELSLSVFICQGHVNWHKHFDEDELFLVHEGVIALDTDRGNLNLHSEELAVVPKGVGHRSGSNLRSVVVLLRPAVMTERRNGNRHVITLDSDPPLEKVRLARAAAALAEPYQSIAVAQVEDFEIVLRSAAGIGPDEVAPRAGGLWLCLRGAVGVEASDGAGARLTAGEFTVVPSGSGYRLSAAEHALLLTAART
jgi:mannose-6-phosphate isomerase-like protein (cupin superfamily)